MKKIKKYLDIRFQKHKEDWDTVIVIDGDVGVGKSNLGLHMLDYWMNLKNGMCKPEDIKHMGLTKSLFLKDLSDGSKNDMSVYDEAGELINRRVMSDFNTKIAIGYKVIRADNIFTILILDNIFDLDPYFRNKRVKALFHVIRRGYVKVWMKQRLRNLLNLNFGLSIKNFNLVDYSFFDKFPKYNGVMKDAYEILKQKKTTQARRQLKLIEPEIELEEEQKPEARRIGVTYLMR